MYPLSATNKHLLSLLILVMWGIICVTSMWYFQFKNTQVLEKNILLSSDSAFHNIDFSDATNQPLVVHFVDTDCVCHRDSSKHIRDIESRYQHQAKFMQINPHSDQNSLPFRLETSIVRATPAVAIWNAKGEFQYFGPYSSGVICGKGIDFVDLVMSQLSNNTMTPWFNSLGTGCFCSVKSPQMEEV
jgi:hypothetical protein